MAHFTPLRYPGGKRKLFDLVSTLLETNGLYGTHYIEPYAGGAGLALGLLFTGAARSIHINDLNNSVFSFWLAVLNDTESLCRLIYDTPVTIDEWFRQKAVQEQSQTLNGSLELAFSTFFLNRTNRSGILKGGVIGGKAQSGEWTLDARFKKKELINRIQAIAEKREQITLTQEDAECLLKQFIGAQEKQMFIYLDPPYYVKGKGLYDNFYEPNDHARVSMCISKLGCPWIVSYDNQPQIRTLYSQYMSITYSLSYSANVKNQGREFMALSHGLRLPEPIIKERMCGCVRNIVIDRP